MCLRFRLRQNATVVEDDANCGKISRSKLGLLMCVKCCILVMECMSEFPR